MADNIAITAGSGTNVRTNDVSGVHYQYVKLDVGGNGVSLPVDSATNAVPTRSLDTVITVDATPDTNALAIGDVAFATQEVAGAATAANVTTILQSVVIADPDDQGVALDLIFFNANTTLGTENSAPDVDDTELLTIIGRVQIGAGAYYDLGTGRIACVSGIGLMMKAGTGGSVWVAGITQGAPTYAGGHLQIALAFMRN